MTFGFSFSAHERKQQRLTLSTPMPALPLPTLRFTPSKRLSTSAPRCKASGCLLPSLVMPQISIAPIMSTALLCVALDPELCLISRFPPSTARTPTSLTRTAQAYFEARDAAAARESWRPDAQPAVDQASPFAEPRPQQQQCHPEAPLGLVTGLRGHNVRPGQTMSR